MFLVASCGSAMVEQLTYDPKVEGFNPTITDIGRKYKRSLMFLLASCGSAMVEHLTHDPKFEV